MAAPWDRALFGDRGLDGGDRLGADAPGHFLVHRLKRRDPGRPLLVGQFVELGRARRLHCGQRLVVFFLGDGVGVVGRLGHGLVKTGAHVLGQAVPELLVHDHRIAKVAVARKRRVLLNLVHLLGIHVRGRVFGPVDDAGLQRLVDFGEGHDLRHRAKRVHFRLKHLGGLDAHLQAKEVVGHMQRAVGRHDLEAVVPVGQSRDPLVFQLGQKRLADLALRDLAQRVVAREDEGQVEDLEVLDAEGAELGQRGGEHLHRAKLQRLKFFLVLVELAVGVDLHVHRAVGIGLGQLLELGRALALGRVGCDDVAELDDDLVLRHGRGGQRQGKRSGAGKRCKCATGQHEILLLGPPSSAA